MARHNNGYRVSSIRCADSPHGLGIPQLFRQLSVASRFAERYSQQSVPNILLEGRTSHIKRYREGFSLPGKVLSQLALCIQEDGVHRIFHEFVQTYTSRLIVLPEYGYQSLIACD